jgi:hypothetical protein
MAATSGDSAPSRPRMPAGPNFVPGPHVPDVDRGTGGARRHDDTER